MQLEIPNPQADELKNLATRTGRSPEALVAEAVDRLIAEDRWFEQQVQIGIDQFTRGEFLEEEEMESRVAITQRTPAHR